MTGIGHTNATRAYKVKVQPVPIPSMIYCVTATITALSMHREILTDAMIEAPRSGYKSISSALLRSVCDHVHSSEIHH